MSDPNCPVCSDSAAKVWACLRGTQADEWPLSARTFGLHVRAACLGKNDRGSSSSSSSGGGGGGIGCGRKAEKDSRCLRLEGLSQLRLVLKLAQERQEVQQLSTCKNVVDDAIITVTTPDTTSGSGCSCGGGSNGSGSGADCVSRGLA